MKKPMHAWTLGLLTVLSAPLANAQEEAAASEASPAVEVTTTAADAPADEAEVAAPATAEAAASDEVTAPAEPAEEETAEESAATPDEAPVDVEASEDAAAAAAPAAPEKKAHPASVVVGASVDNFLGFNIHFAGTYALTDKIDLMLVGTIFTATQFGTNGHSTTSEDGTTTAAPNNAFGLFVPVGPAVRFKFLDGKLSATPFIEVANGGLLSGQRNDPDATHHTGALAEGLVPGIAFGGKFGDFSAGLKGAYFFPIQNLGPYRVQLSRVTATATYKLGWVGVGLLYDWLAVVGETDVDDFKPHDDFMFLGPQFDLHFTERAGVSLAGGADLGRPPEGVENEGRTFYRVSVHTKF